MAKKEQMLNVLFDKIDGNPILDEETSAYYIPFYKTSDYFESYEAQVKFIKEVESMVRKHSFYKKYIAYLVEIVGLKTCQVLSNIEAGDKKEITIEMHHGPILTLFDTVSIILNYLISKDCQTITTFKVADMVIEEHRLNNVRVVLLSKTVHQQVHNDQIFLNYNQGFGDTLAFIDKYKEGVDNSTTQKINDFLDWSDKNDSFDNDVLQISDSIKRWGHNEFILND